jgi:hypothetical protein
MRLAVRVAVLSFGIALLTSVGIAQQPEGLAPDSPKTASKEAPGHSAYVDAFVARMMAFDKDKDGKLTRDEITDERLLRLFDRADANHDGVVTKAELVDLATKMAADDVGGGRRGGPGGRPDGGFGGPGGGPGRPPEPGQILPDFLQEMLNLTAEQKKQVENLQKEVNTKLDKILTDEQKKQLKEMRNRGPGGNGPPPGPPDEDGPPRGPRGRNGQPPGPEGADNPPRR